MLFLLSHNKIAMSRVYEIITNCPANLCKYAEEA